MYSLSLEESAVSHRNFPVGTSLGNTMESMSLRQSNRWVHSLGQNRSVPTIEIFWPTTRSSLPAFTIAEVVYRVLYNDRSHGFEARGRVINLDNCQAKMLFPLSDRSFSGGR